VKILSSAPGRICLFGEHQDYMGLPIIAAAIDLRIYIDGHITEGEKINLDLINLKEKIKFSSENFTYIRDRDYFKSVVRVLKNRNLYLKKNIDAQVKGNIPIQAGTSSSSALVVAWTGFLLKVSELKKKHLPRPAEVAELSYLAEVEEFGESGGRMDQYTSAFGGIVHINFFEQIKCTQLPIRIKEFVLGDSLQPKDTQKTLKRIRHGQETGFKELKKHLPIKFNFTVKFEEAEPFLPKISSEFRPYLRAVLKNHQITDQAKAEFLKKKPDLNTITFLMNKHHEVLREDLKISTPRIEKMIDSALKSGALAAKINGSGEGGCMFAFCPGKQREVAEAISKAGGRPYIINIGKGLEVKSSR